MAQGVAAAERESGGVWQGGSWAERQRRGDGSAWATEAKRNRGKRGKGVERQ